ncbi:hypothetical protein H8356DRAFT_1364967 [Neocallimastix lanati (nom. inval.)]|nr:hypothetical protein H8356DRAFT_1364967 [Neocallimastix sp. JGI-2020a]
MENACLIFKLYAGDSKLIEENLDQYFVHDRTQDNEDETSINLISKYTNRKIKNKNNFKYKHKKRKHYSNEESSSESESENENENKQKTKRKNDHKMVNKSSLLILSLLEKYQYKNQPYYII